VPLYGHLQATGIDVSYDETKQEAVIHIDSTDIVVPKNEKYFVLDKTHLNLLLIGTYHYEEYFEKNASNLKKKA